MTLWAALAGVWRELGPPLSDASLRVPKGGRGVASVLRCDGVCGRGRRGRGGRLCAGLVGVVHVAVASLYRLLLRWAMSYRVGRMLEGLPFGLGWLVVGVAGGGSSGVFYSCCGC